MNINPFKDPEGFLNERDSIKPSNQKSPVIPNPFIDPDGFVSARLAVIGGTEEKNEPITTKVIREKKENKNITLNPFFNPEEFKNTRKFNIAVNNYPIIDAAFLLGASDKGGGKYKINDNYQLNHSGFWHNWNTEVSGQGTYKFIVDVFGSQESANDWIEKNLKDINLEENLPNHFQTENKEYTYVPPINAPENLGIVKAYLNRERGIPLELVERLIAEGRVYADNHKNVVMISKTGQVAELRGTAPYRHQVTNMWRVTKQLQPGSKKDTGCFMVIPDINKIKNEGLVNEKIIAFTEAGIDAISYHVLHPGRGAMSASGTVMKYARKMVFSMIKNGYGIRAAFDNDLPGERASQNIFNMVYIYTHFKQKYGTNEDQFLELLENGVITLKTTLLDDDKTEEEEDTLLEEVESLQQFEISSGIQENTIEDRELQYKILFFNREDAFENSIKPVVRFLIGNNELGIEKGIHELSITRTKYNDIIKKFNLGRDKPKNAKDWNEMIKPKTFSTLPKFN